jgi:hypothetical protein
MLIKNLRYAACAAIMLVASFTWLAAESYAQKGDRGSLTCQDDWYNARLTSHCEIKEQTLPAGRGTLNVDARTNGGIRVRGADRNDILVRARIRAAALTEAEAREIAAQVRVETGGQIRAEGPSLAHNRNWDVSYEIFVPRRTDMSLETYNGGISITDVTGRIEFDAHNGGVHLQNLAGSVRGQTINGGLSIRLTGSRWEGETLDVETTNGGISLMIPDNYSARLETGTVNGSLNVSYPLTLQGRINTKRLSVDLGSGGAPVRVVTTNGGVVIKGGQQD